MVAVFLVLTSDAAESLRLGRVLVWYYFVFAGGIKTDLVEHVLPMTGLFTLEVRQHGLDLVGRYLLA